jgi:hypothetical protein
MTELQPGQVNIHGKVYDTVARRVALMREAGDDYRLVTKILDSSEHRVLVKASLYKGDVVIATGHAEEERGSSQMTQTSAIEVCETSAVGRCLAFADWPGSETAFDNQIASADEVGAAIRAQQDKSYGSYMALVQVHWESIVEIKNCLAGRQMPAAQEAWQELGHDVMIGLWKAPTKGGIFTTEERRLLKEGREDQG